jgi:hypothetical protein
MARGKHTPFGESLGDLREPEGAARLARVRSPEGLIADAAHHAVGVSVDRADKLPLKRQAQLMLGLGLLGCGAVWLVRFVGLDVLDVLGEQADAWVIVVLAVSSITAYGALQLVFEDAEVAGNHETTRGLSRGEFQHEKQRLC